MPTPITTTWLRESGFKWSQLDRQPYRHWLLWMGDVLPDHSEFRHFSGEEFGIEITKGDHAGTWWFVWLRADYAGRYSRFLCAGHYTSVEQVIMLIGGLTGRAFYPDEVYAGALRRPGVAQRFKAESGRLHHVMAEQADLAKVMDQLRDVQRRAIEWDWVDHVELEGHSIIIHARRWPTREERAAIDCYVGIELVGAAT